MKDIIIVRPDRCKGCNACVRVCPAPEANVTMKMDNGHIYTKVNVDKCIACGECLKVCTQGARDYVDDTAVFMSKIKDERMVVIVDPSIRIAYPNQWKGILGWFKKRSYTIFDGGFGADIYTWAMMSLLETKNIPNIVSNSCSALVNYVQMYQPSLVQNLAPVASPTLCAAIYVKNYLRRNEKIVVFSPCIARKFECAETGLIDYSVTFKKLMEYFQKNDIVIPSENYPDNDFEFYEKVANVGSLSTRPGGLCENIANFNMQINGIYSAGNRSATTQLNSFSKMQSNRLPDLLDALSCDFGCGLGPGSNPNNSCFDVIANFKSLEDDMRAKSRGKVKWGDEKLWKKLDDELELDDFIRSYAPKRTSPNPTDADLEPIFNDMGKKTDKERTYNCGYCGYTTCREMATAIYRDINTPDNCIFHVLANKQTEIKQDDEKNAKYEEFSQKVAEKAQAISENLSKIDDASAKTAEKKDTVTELLKNIIAFCNKNTSMDEASVKQMATILETTMNSLESFDENIDVANDGAKAINTSVSELNELLEALKEA